MMNIWIIFSSIYELLSKLCGHIFAGPWLIKPLSEGMVLEKLKLFLSFLESSKKNGDKKAFVVLKTTPPENWMTI